MTKVVYRRLVWENQENIHDFLYVCMTAGAKTDETGQCGLKFVTVGWLPELENRTLDPVRVVCQLKLPFTATTTTITSTTEETSTMKESTTARSKLGSERSGALNVRHHMVCGVILILVMAFA